MVPKWQRIHGFHDNVDFATTKGQYDYNSNQAKICEPSLYIGCGHEAFYSKVNLSIISSTEPLSLTTTMSQPVHTCILC